MTDDTELLEEFTLPGGISGERFSDGSSSYTGEGGGILWVWDDGMASITGPGSEGGTDSIDFLMMAREKLLTVTKGGQPLFPYGNLNVSDSDTWKVLLNFKGEMQSLVEALLKLDAQFFRSLAERMKPTPTKARQAAKQQTEAEKREDLVMGAIVNSAAKKRQLPSFREILAEYRLRQPAETSSQLRDKIARRGFGWMYREGA
jgi:hypothetical protein